MRDLIDFRSSFTATHSSGVSASAVAIAKLFGYSEYELELFQIAGNLHDIGKMAVPNSVLEKRSSLNDDEFMIIKQHPYYTFSVLKDAGLDKRIVEWASQHHENDKGTGYPHHLNSKQISTGSKIIKIADIFTALVEDRPYRKGLEVSQIIEIMNKIISDSNIERKIFNVLVENIEEIVAYTKIHQLEASEYYKSEFI